MIREAVAADQWIEIGALAEEPSRPKRPTARYRLYESSVELYGSLYRAIVVHSSTHDKRRHKRIERLLKKDRKQLEHDFKQATGTAFFAVRTLRLPVKGLSEKPAQATTGSRSISKRYQSMLAADLLKTSPERY